MRFLVDMPLSPGLSLWLVQRGHDAVHALGLGLTQASDAEILEYARRQGRVVVTADLDYPRLLALTYAVGPGLVLLRGGNYTERETEECLRRVLAAIPEGELPCSVVVVDKERVRRRRLPLGRTP